MKGIRGLIAALVAGLVGAACNWIYLDQRSRDVVTIDFVGIKPDVSINSGERLTDNQIEAVPIPAQWAGNLKNYCYLYSERQAVVNMVVWRPQTGRALLLQQDMRPPPPALDLKPGEALLWVPIDSKSFVPSLVVPGKDQVSFIFPAAPTPAGRSILPGRGQPTPAPDKAVDKAAEPTTPNPRPAPDAIAPEIVGPFVVMSLGNRLGDSEATRAARVPVVQENVLGVLAQVTNNKLDAKSERLLKRLEASGYAEVRVVKLAPEKDAAGL